MTIGSKNGNGTVMPETGGATSAPVDLMDLAPGRPPPSAEEARPVEAGESGQATAPQQALLEREDFDFDKAVGDTGSAGSVATPLPSDDLVDLPSDNLPDPLFFDTGALPLETGAGAGPPSGGIGEYREPSNGGAPNSLRDLTPSPGEAGDTSVPGFSAAAFGPSWMSSAGLGPAVPAAIGYNKIVGTPAADRLYGTGESDHIVGLPGSDRVYGGDKADWLQGGDGNDSVYGGDDGDLLDGGDGHDRIYGNAGADRLLGGEGNDRLYIDAGDTLIDGGAGKDTVYVQTNAGVFLDLDFSNVEYAYGHDGDDVFDASALTAATRLDGKGGDDTLLGGSGNDRLYGRAGDDTIAGGDGRDYLYGSDGTDQLDGGIGDDRLYGDGGGDSLFGGEGNDRLYGRVGDDSLSGGSGNDYLYGDGGADSLLGGAGNDRLYIDAGDILIDGGAGIDTVYVQTNAGVNLVLGTSNVEYAYGHNGDDSFDASGLTIATRLDGKGGDDSLSGGVGNDNLYGHAGADSLVGGAGNDRLYIDADDTFIDGGAGTDSLYVQTNAGVSLVLGDINVENAYGRGGDDSFDGRALKTATRLDGKGGDDILLGGEGNDRLYGRGGDDDLAGGLGSDRLYGHAGADSLLGGEGNDRLYGGGDIDSFQFALSFNGDASQVAGQGADRIFDFSAAAGEQLVFTDLIDIDLDSDVDLDDLFALEADDRLEVSESGSRVVLSFNGGGSITIDGMATGAIDSLQDIIDSGANVVV